jgi:heme oxygenase
VADLLEALRTRTAGLHDRLEQLPYFRALYAGELSKLAIVSFLRSLLIVHAVLERELSKASGPVLAGLAIAVRPTVPLLLADLEAIGAARDPSVTPAILRALDFGAEVLAGADDPWRLAGGLYVFDGLQDGGPALRQAYAECLRIGADRLSYLGCRANDAAAQWTVPAEASAAPGVAAGQAATAADAAVRCYEQLETICAALHPHVATDLKHHVTAINFEAGDHAMPQDPVEIDLALRAAGGVWNAYPYLEHRFGSRGRRFTNSDSCWLVTLTRRPVETVTKSLAWLRPVVASRGIPTILLEAHLHAISRELALTFPESIDRPARFDRFLADLDAGHAVLGGGSAGRSQLIAAFGRQLHACTGFRVDAAAPVIASAWLDERSGITGALAAVLAWFTDARRFADDWVATVHAFVAALDQADGSDQQDRSDRADGSPC